MAFPRPFGRYVLDERLAMGGMAEIFRGRTNTEGFEKKVCIKRILPHFTEQEDFVTMFRDEAALAARLQHANIVQVFDFGTEDETLFLAMELVDGADLRKLLDLARKKDVAIGMGHAMQIAIEMCRGLHHAHTLTDDDGRPLGIVHRDISPHNILISRAGEVKVTDFGIAKASARATHTGTGVVKGKLAYMAPEQANSRPIDHRLDQFAAGVVLWEMLTGERLFVGPDEVSVLRKVMMCEVPRPSTLRAELAAPLEDIVMRALAEKPEDRFPTMRHFEHALSRCLFEVTSDPEETNLRPVVERVLGPPEASRRNTAVLVDNPVLSAPGESAVDGSVPSLTAAGFSEVFSASGEEPSGERRPAGTIGAVLGEDSASAHAATVVRDGSSSGPVAPPPAAPAPDANTGVTRTVGAEVIESIRPAGAVTSTPAPAAADARLAPTEPYFPAVDVSPSSEDDEETARVERVKVAPVVPAAPRSKVPLVAAAALVGVVGLALGAVLAVGTDDDEGASDEVTVTLAAPVAEVASEPATTAAPAAASEARGAGQPSADQPSAGEPTADARSDEPVATAPPPAEEPVAAEPAPPAPEPAKAVETPRTKPARAKAARKQPTAAAAAPTRRQQRAERPRPRGKLILEMASGWAHAYLGKRKLCETPCSVELPAGTHTLRLQRGDGSELRHRVTVKADATVRAVVPVPR